MKTKICSIFGLVAFVIAPFAWAADIPPIPKPDPAVAEFARGVKFTVAGYNGGAEVQTNFPVLVRLSTAITGFDYNDFYNKSVDPTDPDSLKLVDIGFVDAETNGIPYEIDTWDPSGESLIWVNLPRMTNGTEFAMWYRSSKTGKALNPDNVWTNYAGVWHFREDYGAETASVNVYDSTTNELTGSTIYTAGTTGGQQPATVAASVSGGKLGRSRRMGSNYHDNNKGKGGIDVLLGESDSAKRAAVNKLTPAFSGSFWIYGENKFRYPYYVSRKKTDGSTAWGFQSRDDKADAASKFGFWSETGANNDKYRPSLTAANISQRTWAKIDFVYTAEGSTGKGYLYKNGVPVNNVSVNLFAPAVNGGDDLYIGGGSGSDTRPLIGLMDEVRLCYSVPTAARVKADFDTVNDAAFLTKSIVVTNAITERPVVNFTVADIGASHIQFGGNLTSLGSDQATNCTFYAKVWPTASAEPAAWTVFATNLTVGAFSGLDKGLTPATAYSYALMVSNDVEALSYETRDTFMTSGVGVSGTGGDVTRVGDDWIHYFRVALDDEDAVTNVYTFTPPSYATTVRALVVAGGGPGGYRSGGGGGAGGYIYNAALAVEGGNAYTITVGEGGAASGAITAFGSQGGNSSISNGVTEVICRIGGGAGGNGHRNNATWCVGQSGGSGGGASGAANNAVGTAAPGQGNNGGKGESVTSSFFGGGGGGAGSSGESAFITGNNVNAPSGGSGLECDITGVATFYAGGGGAGSDELASKPGAPGSGGSGIGGTGSRKVSGTAAAATQGMDGTGSGGGGGCGDDAALYQGGDGGDGIVIIRYASQGDPSTVPGPIISLKRAVCNDLTFKGDVTFRVAWAGYNEQTGKGYETANVKIKWGYSRNNLVHTTDVLVSNVIGIASASFDLIADECTVYCRAVAVNDANVESESTETLSFYVNDNPKAQEDDATPILAGVGLSHVDALYAVVTGMVVSTGVSSAEPKVCKVRVKIGSTENNLVVTNEMNAPVGPFALGIAGLNEQTTYYYCVEAVDDNETAVDTDPESFTTIPAASVLGALTTSTSLTNYTISGSLSVVGAGTTHILVKWGEGEWEEIGAFNVLSNDTSFSATYNGTWDDSSITGQLMCSNACELVDGTPAGDPYVTTQNNSFSPVDDATYTWQPVNDDWNGDWNDPAHWASSKVGRGYPDNAYATADFVNCTTANPVTVNVNGKFLTNKTKFYGSAASDITFVGTGTNTSSLSSGYAQNAINSNSKVEFRDMAFTMRENWEVLRTADKTNVTFRLSNVAANCTGYFALSAPFCRAEFVDGTVFSAAAKFNMGGTNTVCLIDDSTVTAHAFAIMNADCSIKGNLQYVFKGMAPKFRLLTSFYPFSDSPNVSFTFFVPVGGYAEPPIQLTHTSNKFLGNNTCDAHFYVAEDSPALVKSSQSLENVVIVDTKAGLKTENIVGGIGVVPEHGGVSCGAFKYGVGGEPLADGAALSTARQILLDLQGKSNGIMFLIY